MAIIEAANVTRTYGKGSKGSSVFTAVAGVSLSVARGELVSVLGVNGAAHVGGDPDQSAPRDRGP